MWLSSDLLAKAHLWLTRVQSLWFPKGSPERLIDIPQTNIDGGLGSTCMIT